MILRSLASLLVISLCSGCLVSKARFAKQKSETDTCYEALQKENERKKELADAVENLQKTLADLAAERKRLAAEKGSLEGNVAELEQQVTQRINQITKLAAERDKLAEERAELQEKTDTYDALVQSLKDEMKEKLIAVTQKGRRLTVNLSDRILFDSGSAAVKAGGQTALKKIADILAKVNDRRIDVEGHTDNVPITGDLAKTYPSNWELSAVRATNVVRFLEDNGVNPERMAAVGKSKYRPVASNKSSSGRQLNRRIDIVLTPWDGDK